MMEGFRIVATTDVAGAAEAFGTLGRVELVPPSELDSAVVRRADALVVRSAVSVNAALLADSRVRFVGTATAGYDHLDVGWLRRRGIRWCSARGCNREAVADYVIAAYFQWLAAADPGRMHLPPVAVVGCGHTGSAVAHRLRSLGVRVWCCDPPKQRRGVEGLVSLERALAGAEVVTFHVPLRVAGQDRTFRLIDAQLLRRAPRARLVINTSRGWVMDPLLGDSASGLDFVVDVWWWETALPPERRTEFVLPRLFFATPHLAGRSLEGLYRGTYMVYRKLCRFLGRRPQWRPPDPASEKARVKRLDLGGCSAVEAVAAATRMGLNLDRITADFRRILGAGKRVRADGPFRRRYAAVRRRWSDPRCEFSRLCVQPLGCDARTLGWLEAAGFRLATAG